MLDPSLLIVLCLSGFVNALNVAVESQASPALHYACLGGTSGRSVPGLPAGFFPGLPAEMVEFFLQITLFAFFFVF